MNGHLVFDKAPDCVYMEDFDNRLAHIPIIKEDIKNVVTKEQMESIMYKVKE